jgi:hypothetical protein
VSISLTGGEISDKKNTSFLPQMVSKAWWTAVTSIEKTLGIYELAQFTPRI